VIEISTIAGELHRPYQLERLRLLTVAKRME
jgi:hypothetical protein